MILFGRKQCCIYYMGTWELTANLELGIIFLNSGCLFRLSVAIGAENRVCYFDCLKGSSKLVQVLFNGIEAVLVLTLIILK